MTLVEGHKQSRPDNTAIKKQVWNAVHDPEIVDGGGLDVSLHGSVQRKVYCETNIVGSTVIMTCASGAVDASGYDRKTTQKRRSEGTTEHCKAMESSGSFNR